jgi:transcriptional regulator with XRE-family HTH domain
MIGGDGMGARRDALAARREALGLTQQTFAERLGVELSTVGRWERGEAIPQPWRRLKIAGALAISLPDLDRLLGDATADELEQAEGRTDAPLSSEDLVVDDAQDAARFARQITASTVGRFTLDQIDLDVRRFATDYVSQPLSELFVDIRELRAEVFQLVQRNKFPDQMRQLYLYASRLGGLQAHVCLDLGHYHAAGTQARTAWLCAELAGHNGMRAWVRGLQSLIAYWDGRQKDAVRFARDGAAYCDQGSVAARLPSLEARACAKLGDKRGALDALDRAERARAVVHADDDAGVFTFPAAKQSVYAGTTLLALGERSHAARAVTESSQALTLYESAAPAERSSGDMLAARLDLASAYLLQDQLDGTQKHLKVVLAAPQVRRTASIIQRASGIGRRIAESRYANSLQGKQIRGEITAFCASPPAVAPDPV